MVLLQVSVQANLALGAQQLLKNMARIEIELPAHVACQ
jgi:hypothetical protein